MVDLNRAGVGLIELVSEPEISTPAEASLFVQRCHEIFQDLRICSGNLEQGAMRIDVNVNLVDRSSGAALTPRVELKNINGISVIESAVRAELLRQQKLLDQSDISAAPLQEETRLYSPERNETILLRAKDSSASYRYLPEYDLPPIDLDSFESEAAADHLLSTRHERIKLLQADYPQLISRDGLLLRLWTRPEILPTLFESALKLSSDPRFLLNWCVGELLAILNHPEAEQLGASEITGVKLAALADAVKSGRVDKEIAKTEMLNALKESRDLEIKSPIPGHSIPEDLINQAMDELFRSNPDRVNFLKSPEGQARGSVDFFVGPLLKQFRGQISAKELQAILRSRLLFVN